MFLIKKSCPRLVSFKDNLREKAQSNKTPTLTKSTNMGIWVAGISNQLFIRGYLAENKFKKLGLATGKTLFFVIGPFYIHRSICLNIGS